MNFPSFEKRYLAFSNLNKMAANCSLDMRELCFTLAGCGGNGLVGDSVRGDERLASISSAIANDVYSRLCLWDGVEPGCLKPGKTGKNKTARDWTVYISS